MEQPQFPKLVSARRGWYETNPQSWPIINFIIASSDDSHLHSDSVHFHEEPSTTVGQSSVQLGFGCLKARKLRGVSFGQEGAENSPLNPRTRCCSRDLV